MAPTDLLNAEARARRGAPWTSPSEAGPAALFSVPVPGVDRTRARIVTYWVMLLAFLFLAVLGRTTTWLGNASLHTLLEAVAGVFGIAVGGLALVRYYARPERLFLHLAVGFLGAGILTVVHATVTGPLAPLHSGEAFSERDSWTWLAAQLHLGLFLMGALAAGMRVRPQGAALRDRWIYLAGTLSAVSLGALALRGGLPTAVRPTLGVDRPFELVPALFLALALVGFLRREGWRSERFQHWLVMGLWMGVVSHVAYMAFSTRPFDGLYDMAHVLKVGSYLAVLVGLLLSLYARLRLGGEAFVAERVLKESRHQLQDFLDNASDLLQSAAPDGRILYANRAWKQALGYTDGEIAKLDIFSIVHPNSLSRFRRQFQRVLGGESATHVEVEFVAADGRIIICSGNMNCRFEDGKPVATRSIFRDVTEQRQAERALEASKANLTALVENTGDAIWSVDPQLRLITFNAAFSLMVEARTGREPRVGAPLEAVLRIDEVEWYRELYQRALAGARFSQVRTEEIDGQERHFELFFNPILGDLGPRGVVVFGKDVTPRRRAEEALRVAKEEAEAANRAKSHFLASMSHELRTPLNSVIGFANVLLKNRSGGLSDQDLEFTRRIHDNGKHLLTLINDVLDLAKVESGRMEVELAPVDVRTLVRETLHQLEGQVRGRAVQLKADVPDDLRPLRTDPRRLKQVIINLVGNALKFTETGEVRVHVEASGATRQVTSIAVVDTGIGIPTDRLDAIFEAFQQAEAGTTRRYGGTGLGLTISRSICQLLGYQLTVSSTVGEGSQFRIAIPETMPRPGREPLLTPPGRGLEELDLDPRLRGRGRQLALVVDDEPDSSLLIVHHLKEFGLDVVMAASGEAGLARARERKPDLITVDLMMPGMSGWEFIRQVKADPDLQDVPVVVVSIVAGEGGGRTLGAVDLLTKPVERDAFLRTLWRSLPRNGRRILLVDDDAATRDQVERYLSTTELEVQSVTNGREALNVLSGYHPDLVLLDLMMPVMDGMTFLNELRSDPEYLGLPVVVLTAKTLTPAERAELELRTSGVVQKSDDLRTQLRDVVSNILSERGALTP
ncbi:MAG: response regulator [Gemmatimonadota bacterium]|nr:response regulator [Gemmatimonadota bacterium]